MRIIRLPNVKTIRAEVIRDRLPPGTRRIVCLSCGNATRALEGVIKGVPVIKLDSESPVSARRELSAQEIQTYFGPESFNATSGYLPLDLTAEIGQRLMAYIPELLEGDRLYVPCGSGETIAALSNYIPLARMTAVSALYPPIEAMGPLYRWLAANMKTVNVGRVNSVAEALRLAARGKGFALCWE
ncbi:MAG: hypothetical protein HZB23_15570 [Deltaproteobacteria bacterium]|nr:hypothetical protein [Deltaproteobacteria bacterium]